MVILPTSGGVLTMAAHKSSIWRYRLTLLVFLAPLAFLGTVFPLSAHAREEEKILQAFSLRETFGVAHPTQVVEVDLVQEARGKPVHLVGPDGRVVPSQILRDGKLALQTDLPAGAARTWKLLEGSIPPQVAVQSPVKLYRDKNCYEVTNGLTGVRIPDAARSLQPTPAPIQGLLCSNGQWTATGPNYLSPHARRMEVHVLEEGPLKVVMEVLYAYDRPEVILQGQTAPGNQSRLPAGEGHYRSTITVDAGQPSLLIEEDTDMDVSYSLDVYPALHPTQARYRGHHATSAEQGREPDGQTYRPAHERPNMDAVVDLSYNTQCTYPPMAVWNPWIVNGGWYWQLYDPQAAPSANVLGIFAGPCSRAIGAAHSGIEVYTTAEGVEDLVTQIDPAGNLHAVYRAGQDLWYVKVRTDLRPEAPEKIGKGLIHADLLVRAGGEVSVVAFDPVRRNFIHIERRAGGGVSSRVLDLTPNGLERITGEFAYQAESDRAQFLFLFGEHEGKAGGLLFARRTGEEQFSFQQWLPAEGHRQVARPTFARLVDGRVALLFTDSQHAHLAIIEPGALNFGTTPNQQAPYQHLNFGSALDARTGNLFVADNTGALALLTPEGSQLARRQQETKLGLGLDHHGQGPNRRSLTADDHGRVLAVHGNRFFLFQDGRWKRFEAADQLQIASPRVAFHTPTNQFVLLGRVGGKLSLFGFRAGDEAPRLLHALRETEQRSAGIRMAARRFSPDTRFFPRVRFSWGIFAGVKGRDLKPATEVQPIAAQMNLRAIMNLSKLHRLELEFPDPPGGFGSLYMEKRLFQKKLDRLQRNRQYYQDLVQAEPTGRPLLEIWTDPFRDARITRRAAGAILELSRRLLMALIHGDGIYDARFGYWQGGLEMSRMGLWIDAVLANSAVPDEEKAQVKAAAALFAQVLWDDDFVPLFDGHGLNLGTANMPVQQSGYRDFYALLLANHPAMKVHAQVAAQHARWLLHRIVNEHGAAMGSTHYMSASMEPTLNTLLQVQARGEEDPFREEERLARFAEFSLNLLTPPEVRFGGRRKLIAVGDSSTESTPLFGILATGFRTANPRLSARTQGAWIESGQPQSGFFGSTLAKIDELAPAEAPVLGNATFPGWYSVLRHGWGTSNESACWFIDGDFYSDHRHHDQGSVVLYALGAPLSLDWGSMYSPQAAGAFLHSTVLPEDRIGHRWDQDNPPLGAGSAWARSAQDMFLSFAHTACAQAHFTAGPNLSWTRSVYAIHPREDLPAFFIRDTFHGAEAACPKVFSLNMTAQGDVETPAGKMSPPPRTYGPQQQLPSAGKVFELPAGPQRLSFRGQWLIDWDLWTVAEKTQQAHIGNWGHKWHPLPEQAEFAQANRRAFEEHQHLLRLKGQGPFQVLLLPYRKRERPDDLLVQQDGETLHITSGGAVTLLGDGFCAYRDARRRLLAVFGQERAEADGLRVTGGPLEIWLDGGRASITAHGPAGKRVFRLPGEWQKEDTEKEIRGLSGRGDEWVLDYSGGYPQSILLHKN
jgi:hypothetical protein